MNPTIICNNHTLDTGDLTYAEFGDVVLSTGGSVNSILRCDVGTSSAVSFSSQGAYLTESDFYELWGALAGLLCAGYIVKRLLRVLVN